MADTKYTLSRNKTFRSDDPELERAWLARAHELHYALPNRPQRAGSGDYVYFVHDGQMKARAKIAGTVPGKARRTYTRRMRPAAPVDLAVQAPIEIARPFVPARGFQGFRYLTPTETARFAGSFR